MVVIGGSPLSDTDDTCSWPLAALD